MDLGYSSLIGSYINEYKLESKVKGRRQILAKKILLKIIKIINEYYNLSLLPGTNFMNLD